MQDIPPGPADLKVLLATAVTNVATLGSTPNGAPPSEPPPPPVYGPRDPYRAVIGLLFFVALIGTAGAVTGGVLLSIRILLAIAVNLGLAAGVLAGVATAQMLRARSAGGGEKDVIPSPVPEEPDAAVSPDGVARLKTIPGWFRSWFVELGSIGTIRVGAGLLGATAVILVWQLQVPAATPSMIAAAVAAGICLIAAGLAATAVRYLTNLDPALLPEAPGLCRGSRVVAWMLLLAAASIGLAYAGQTTILNVLYFLILAIDVAVCYELIASGPAHAEKGYVFPLDLAILSILGSRTNVAASVLDAGERQLGIDLRSTWALSVVRRSAEPLLIGLAITAWLSTSFTIVGLQEQGIVERLGVPQGAGSLTPGLHLHWPWPVDRVFRISVQRVQSLTVGHEGQEEGGPENVLWAVEHAENEYTLLLGNGRDLITVDAAVQFRIRDPRAWRYNTQNPEAALKAIAYRAVMRNTVDKTLSDALSENVAILTRHMRDMVQQDADALGLGVDVVGFTVGGMHPPVPVASDYQAVVSAELGKVTDVVNAQAFRTQSVAEAEAAVIANQNDARARGAEDLARAAGQAWSFRTLESQFRSDPQEYYFRRRLETLESGLAGRHFTIIDSRFQRDGGELWLNP